MATSRPSAPVLIWTAGTGGGHQGVARAIAAAARCQHPGRPVQVDEPLERASPTLRRLLALYGPLVRRSPWAWGGLFHLTEAPGVRPLLAAGLDRAAAPALRAELERRRPAVVCVVHPLLVAPALAARAQLAAGDRPPVVVLVTDLAGAHRSWAHPGADLTLTGSPDAAGWAVRAGVPADRIEVPGLPVHPALADPGPGPTARRRLRAALGLHPDRFCVLVTGGGEGASPLAAATARLAWSGLPIQLAVVCGRNRRLAARLERWRPPVPLRVVGWAEDMVGWLRAADLVVGKAGPSTVAEAAAAGLPLLLLGALPGQERPNLELVTRAGFGRPARGAALVRLVAQVAVPGSAAYAAMRAAARSWSRPQAAVTVVDRLLALAGPPPAPGA